MKNCLVFFTKTFPFDAGEEFIANELPIISQEFEKVILIATSVSDNAVQTRPVPDNTEVYQIRASAVKRAVKEAVLKNFFVCPKEYKKDCRADGAGCRPLRRLFFSYFLSKATAVFQESKAALSKTDADPFDAVTFYSYWFYDTAFAAVKLKQTCRAPHCAVYSRAHGYDLYPERSPFHYLPLRPFLLKNLDRVFPCSEHGSNYLKSAYPAFAEKVSTAYLGTRDYGVGPADRENEYQIVSCCHIVPVKRVELLAQALLKLSGKGMKLRWTHFGGGDGLDGLKQYAGENLGFLRYSFPGEVTNGQLMKFYKENHVDLFVNTSSSEGLPVSIMEACSFGIPVLATDVGGTSEIVGDGRNGFLIDADSTPEQLAEKIERLYGLPETQQKTLRAASREIWECSFCAAANYSQFARRIDPFAR